MASPVRVYDKKVRVNLTSRHLDAIRREQALSGATTSDVIRASLDHYLFFKKAKRRRAS